MEKFTGSFKAGIVTDMFQIKYSLPRFPRVRCFFFTRRPCKVGSFNTFYCKISSVARFFISSFYSFVIA